ncbi:S-layer domain-containing protein [Lysobacter dokdonensis DS-58]|uniref:S-layer domain-containing protein n=1 Tax=Lysobacter dokdonensis DS-58 TaxID=1300345 RepID=A0A0A2WJK1_9GAMM|nr:hypothetical protein [Lysobacter dokdonensis]KGQ18440.1 S-layer domain-containing protein [Lysobacter dokdonensis DS-58]
MTASPRQSQLLRTLLAACLIVTLLSVASAQSVPALLATQVEAITATVIGRAPVVTVAVENLTRPGEDALVGNALRATATATDPDDDTITATSYRWLRGGVEIANTNTYTVVQADLSETLSVEAIATTDSAITDPASGTGSTDVAVTANTEPTATPTITGAPKVGVQLTGNPGYADAENDPPGAHVYRWYRADTAAGEPRTPIDGATNATYKLADADLDKYLVFGIVPVSTVAPTTGVESFAVTSAKVVMATPPAAQPAITGDLTVGATVIGHVNYSGPVDDPEGVHSYRWLRSDDAAGLVNQTPIEGATGTTLALTEALSGKFLAFEVTPRTVSGVEGATAIARTPLPVGQGQRHANSQGGVCSFQVKPAFSGLRCQRNFMVSGRPGNGQVRSFVGVSYNPQTNFMADAYAELTAPDGTVYVVLATGTFRDGPGFKENYGEVDLSSESMNGNWVLHFWLSPSTQAPDQRVNFTDGGMFLQL